MRSRLYISHHACLPKQHQVCIVSCPYEQVAVLQNPVNTMAWYTVQMLLLAPLVGLVRDCAIFCVPPIRTKPFACLGSLYFIMLTAVITCGPAVHANLFHLYVYPSSFRWKFELLGVSTIALFMLCMHTVRSMLFMYAKQKIQAVRV